MALNFGQVVLPLGRRQPDGMVGLLGTCFAVSHNKFATAAHVTGPSDSGLSIILPRIYTVSDYQDTTDSSIKMTDATLVDYDPVRDISIIQFKDDAASVHFSYTLGGSDAIPTGTSVVSLGFPHADMGRLVLTQQASIIGARVLLGSNGGKTKHVVLNTQTRPGQSGGPVFSVDGTKVHAMIVGGFSPAKTLGVIIGGIDPQSLNQTTHAVSAEYIKAMLK